MEPEAVQPPPISLEAPGPVADLPHLYLAASNSRDLGLRETAAAGVVVYFDVPPGR